MDALTAAARYAAAQGSMKKISVDELCAEAGISKGAFYKFYPSKEHLFLDVMERWHQAMSMEAEKAVQAAGSLNGQERAALMMKTACRVMREQPLARFQENGGTAAAQAAEEAMRNHTYEAAVVHQILEKMHVKLTVSEEQAFNMAADLFRALRKRQTDGPSFDEALNLLIDCACKQIIEK